MGLIISSPGVSCVMALSHWDAKGPRASTTLAMSPGASQAREHQKVGACSAKITVQLEGLRA